MIPRRHSTKLPTISSIRPITIRAIQGRPYAQSGVFSRSRGTATKRRTQGCRSGYSDNDDSRLFSKVPVTHYYSWTLPPGLPLRTLQCQLGGGEKFDGVFLCSKIFRTPKSEKS